MALLQISAKGSEPQLYGSPQGLEQALAHALLTTTGPITFLVHGFKYAPGTATCPHASLFSLAQAPRNPRIVSWPRHLKTEGVTIGFGWQARGTLWSAYDRASAAGSALAEVARLVQRVAPHRPRHVLAHSMGARVALQSLAHLDGGGFETMILMAAAEYRSQVAGALATPAGRRAQILHVTSGENDMYDFLFERFIRPPERADRALGTQDICHARTLLLDDVATLRNLAAMGHPIAGPARRICHWSPYLRPGVFDLYRALLSGALPWERLDRALPARQHRRWSRLLRAPRRGAPLPIPTDASV